MRCLPAIHRFPVVALVITASMAVVGASIPAGASGIQQSVTCSTVTGNPFGPAELFSCSGTTGGAGQIEPYPFFVTGRHTGTISWSLEGTTHVTTVISARTRVVTPKKVVCSSANYPTEIKVRGKVRADTSGDVTVGGPVSATLCRSSGGAIVLVPGTAIVIG
jgi:hypothetical protein